MPATPHVHNNESMNEQRGMYSDDSNKSGDDQHKIQTDMRVIVIGAGMTGLMSARHLLLKGYRVTILEANDYVGGRVFSKDGDLDLGAETVHGSGTALTDLIEELRGLGYWKEYQDNDHFSDGCLDSAKRKKSPSWAEEIFITSAADGGPNSEATNEGKFGMYYFNGSLISYNDSAVQPLTDALDHIFHDTIDPAAFSVHKSVGSALSTYGLSPELLKLANASYGNTGAGPIEDMSLSMIAHWEKHWEIMEEEGDYRPRMGMHAIVSALLEQLRQDINFELILNAKVTRVDQDDSKNAIVQYISIAGQCEELQAPAIIVTIPPNLYQQIQMQLSPSKQEALSFIGFERIIKVVLRFQKRLWPPLVQNLVCAEEPVPEIWFRPWGDDVAAVGYLTSTAADDLVKATSPDDISDTKTKAKEIFLKQLVKMFQGDWDTWYGAVTEVEFHDWRDHPHIGGGYMYPKVGLTPGHVRELAKSQGRIFFGGEATNTNASATIQAAMETGIRAAKEVCSSLQYQDTHEKSKHQLSKMV
jgi:monoamine oxidase